MHPTGSASISRRLHLAGAVVLVAGWLAAVVVFIMAGRNEAAQDAADVQLLNGQVYATPLGAAKREQQQLARLGGQASVRIVEFDGWLASLWHGERLGWTLALLSTAVGGACIYLAGLAAEDAAQ